MPSPTDIIMTALLGKILELKPTALWYDTGASIEISDGPMAVTVQSVTIEHDNGSKQNFSFSGAGIGISGPLPGGISISSESFPSTGGNIRRGPAVWGTLEFDDLVGPGHIISVSFAAGPGGCVGILLFGEIIDFLLFTGATWFACHELGTSSLGIVCYKGLWRKDD